MVDAMCTPGGMRVAPEAQDLRQFVESVSGMDGLRVAELLREKMVSNLRGENQVTHTESVSQRWNLAATQGEEGMQRKLSFLW